MKRIIAIILAALMMTAVLAACGGDKAETTAPVADNAPADNAPADNASSVSLSSVLDSINTQFGFEGLKVLDDVKALNRYYQIAETDVKQFAGELSTAASQYTEVVLVEANDSTAAQNIKAQLDAHRDAQLNNAKSYDADQVAMIESCATKTSGNFVYLVISDKYDEICGVIESALK